jgi:DNA-binding response OmpR family regulator
MMKILLELEGFDVEITRQAREVLPLLERERPDALVMDFHLGEEDGVNVLQTIRDTPTIADTPVIVVSGLQCGWEAEKAGADVFLLKPFAADQLLEALRKALKRDRKPADV